MARSDTGTRPSEARLRLLTTATRIFYAEGIHSVGVDRIIAEAKVTRATFYRHFPSKENLVVTYLHEVHETDRARVDAVIAACPSAGDAVLAIADAVARDIQSPGFRGCAFLNAAAEFPDADSPVRQRIVAHRQWLTETLEKLMAQVAREASEPAARHFIMLRDGAMAAGCLFDPALVADTFLRGVEGLVRIHGERKPVKSARPAQ